MNGTVIICLLLITMIILYSVLLILMIVVVCQLKKNIKKFSEDKLFTLLVSISSIMYYVFSQIVNNRNKKNII
jgi:hypothetical protein